MKKINSLSVVGLGKLGLCIAACFADKGFRVIGVDVDIDKLNSLNKGISPVRETGLAEIIKKLKNKLKVTLDYEEAILNTDVSFVAVGTPSLADGSFSNEYVEKAIHKIAEALKRKKKYHLVVITSTVMPQTTGKIVKFLLEKISRKKCGRHFGLAYNPEFIALGSVIHDFLNPDFILIGETNKKDGDILEEIYKKTCQNYPRFVRMSPLNAELTKLALNCYITTKITFANSLGSICEKIEGADAYAITQALGLDSRIGTKYIRPGLGYGGPCFPRDNQAYASFARKLEIRAKLAEMVDEVNRDQILKVIDRIKEVANNLNKKIKDTHIGILGLSYKPYTSVIEDSQALSIVQVLANEGYQVSVYDPQAQEDARGVLGDTVRYAKNKDDCLKRADIGVIAVPWEEFKEIDFKKLRKRPVLLDCWMILKAKKGANIRYLGVGY